MDQGAAATSTADPSEPTHSNGAKKQEYHPQLSDLDMEELSKRHFAANSERKMKWVLKVYEQWRVHCMVQPDCDFRIIWSDLNFPHTLVK